MFLIRQGQAGPRIIVLQCVLQRTGMKLAVDGVFGPATKRAVIAFQKGAGKALKNDGIVGPKTWAILSQTTGFYVIDVVDVVDQNLELEEVKAIKGAGGDPKVLHGMSNGVAQAVQDVFLRANTCGLLAAVRFHSHGAPGLMNVSAGKKDMSVHLAGIANSNIAQTGPILSRLSMIMASFGCIDFMGCNVGRGAAGRNLLQSVAQYVGRPASAGVNTQYASATGFKTFNFEGPVVTAYPNHSSRLAWARSVAVA